MELAKYIVLLWHGREQAVAFPQNTQHAAVFNYIGRQSPETKAVSAGFFLDEPEVFWHGGESESLRLTSRAQDAGIIQAMIRSRDRRIWDLRLIAFEAQQSVHRQSQELPKLVIEMG